MSVHLLRALDNLQRDLIALAGLVEDSIHKATRALQTRDVNLARRPRAIRRGNLAGGREQPPVLLRRVHDLLPGDRQELRRRVLVAWRVR